MTKIAIAIGIGVGIYLALPLIDRFLLPYLPGNPCSTDEPPICLGNETLLKCVGGAWVDQPCRGGKGCSGRHVSRNQGDRNKPSVCDTSRNREGDTCFGDAPKCAAGSKTALVCEGGRLTTKPCPAGCDGGVCP